MSLSQEQKRKQTALEEEEDGEGKGCTAAQWGEKAFSHTSEINQSAKSFSVSAFIKEILYILTSAKLLMFVKRDLSKAVRVYTWFIVTK